MKKNYKYSSEGLRKDIPKAITQVKESTLFRYYKSYFIKKMDLYRFFLKKKKSLKVFA